MDLLFTWSPSWDKVYRKQLLRMYANGGANKSVLYLNYSFMIFECKINVSHLDEGPL